MSRRSKRILAAEAHSATKKKQKTSTPSRSRIEHYMSPGNISKVVGSPIQHQQSTLNNIEISDRSVGGERSKSQIDGDRKRKGKKADDTRRPGNSGDAVLEENSNKSRRALNIENVASSSGSWRSRKVTKNSQKSKTANLSRSLLQNATIDKYMSPDLSSSAVATPTRYLTFYLSLFRRLHRIVT